MLEDYQEWKRKKNLFTFTKLAVLISVVLFIGEHTAEVSEREVYLAATYMVVVTLLIVAYRKFQHEPYLKGMRLDRRNSDFSMKPWEFTYPQKLWEAGKLLSINGKAPVLAFVVLAFVFSPAFIAKQLEVPQFARTSYDFLFTLPDPEIHFASNGSRVSLATLINEPSFFWVWDERTSINQADIFFEAAINNPEISFYTARSYGNFKGLSNEYEDVPENVTFLEPYGFNLGDSSLFENLDQQIIYFDTEGEVLGFFETPSDLASERDLVSLFPLE